MKTPISKTEFARLVAKAKSFKIEPLKVETRDYTFTVSPAKFTARDNKSFRFYDLDTYYEEYNLHLDVDKFYSDSKAIKALWAGQELTYDRLFEIECLKVNKYEDLVNKKLNVFIKELIKEFDKDSVYCVISGNIDYEQYFNHFDNGEYSIISNAITLLKKRGYKISK